MITAVTPLTALASLGLCLGTGIWVGYRWALASKKLDAVIDHALAKVDSDWEDEVPTRRRDEVPCRCLADDPWSRAAATKPKPKDWDWDWEAEKWWGRNA